MMPTPHSSPQTSANTSRVLLVIAAAVVGLAFALWGETRGIAALVGASVSLANWFALRWLTLRILDNAGGASKAAVSLLLIGKIGLLMAIVYVLIQRLRLDPVGLAFGLGVLFLGPAVAGLLGGGRAFHPAASKPDAGNLAREER